MDTEMYVVENQQKRKRKNPEWTKKGTCTVFKKAHHIFPLHYRSLKSIQTHVSHLALYFRTNLTSMRQRTMNIRISACENINNKRHSSP